jgi:3-phenylpropionate/cinnamic acid dioxygenase small subunit
MKSKLSVEDRFDLHDLIARYAWALDVGDVDAYLDCFFEDGWIEHHPPGRCEGRAAIRKLTDFLWYEHPKSYLGRQHRMSQVLMTPEGDGVRIKAFWSILQHDVKTQENFIYGLGTWDALAMRDGDGQWRLKTLFVDIWRGDNVPWVGDPRAWTKGEMVQA